MLVCYEFLSFGIARLAAAAHERGIGLVLLTKDPDFYGFDLEQALHPIAVLTCDTDSVDDVEKQLVALGIEVDGVVSTTDTWSVQAAQLAARLGVPGHDLQSVALWRDKASTREILAAAGAMSPPLASWMIGDDAPEVESGELPIVVKDASGTGSMNVRILRDSVDLSDVGRDFASAGVRKVVVESCFDGPLMSVEALTFEGVTRILGITQRRIWAGNGTREDASIFPAALQPSVATALHELVPRALRAAGYENGFTHTELIITGGGPEIVEINFRLGGALVGEMMCRTYDTNIYDALIDLAFGRRPALFDADLEVGRHHAMGLIYPESSGVFDGVLNEAPNTAFYPTRRKGTRIQSTTDQAGCLGLTLISGATALDAELRMMNEQSMIRVLMRAQAGTV